jgi:glycosyltransferase involved in cell wall biosynthesis
MALDTDIWKPGAPRNAGRQVVIGWTGSPVNIPNIERIGPLLALLVKKYPFLRIILSSGQKPSLPCDYEYIPFAPGAEPAFVQRLDIGLLPLTDEEYSRGKSPVKALQYLACGVPVVGNVFGATAEILSPENSIAVISDDQWLNALDQLINDEQRRKSLGEAGRRFVVERHSTGTIRKQLLDTLLSLRSS